MKTSIELIIGIIILTILAVFLNPTKLLMPDSINNLLIVGLILGFLAFVGMVWQEKSKDERDTLHIHRSARISFMAGAFILVIGILVQALNHNIDPWLIHSLAVMVLVKLTSRIFDRFKH